VAVSNRGQVVVVFSDADGRLTGRVLTSAEVLEAPPQTAAHAPAPPLPGGAASAPASVAQNAVELGLDDFGAVVDYQLAAASTLGFVVVAQPAEPNLSSSGLGDVTGTLLAQAFGFNGQSRSGIVAISSDLSASQPSIAIGADGQAVIGWSEESLDGDLDPRLAFFAKGLAIGRPETVLDLERPGDQRDVTVAMNSAGDTIAVWTSQPAAANNGGQAASAGSATSMVARGFDAQGTSKGDDLVVAESDATTEPTDPSVSLTDDDLVNVAFQKKNRTTGASAGVFDQQIEKAITSGVCTPDAKTLCLNDLRFQVNASWSDAGSGAGIASSLPLTDDTGAFWFFEASNIEIVLKALDACALSNTYWVFAGGLTDVEVNLTITDVVAGRTRVYSNTVAQPFAPIQDTGAFATCDDSTAPPAVDPASDWRASAAAATPCSGEKLCLNQGRFQVELEFSTPGGGAGAGRPATLTDDTGTFWFFEEANVEAVVKVLDACAIGDRFWVFAAGLTDVAATLTVTDTITGATRTYDNPQSTPFRPVIDTDAFVGCP
jgi:hypothetical protein